jgi:lysophospholipase L1-like esterase
MRVLLFVAAVVLAGGVFRVTGAGDEPVEARECQPRGGLPNFIARLKTGGEVKVAYLGGSITAQQGWRPKTLKWFGEQFPGVRVSEINAAIGGTGSDLGVFRLQHDVLQHKPDLLFVEFAVNDAGASPEQIYRSIEGIVRKTWKADPATDICFVYTLAGNMLETLKQDRFPRSATAMEKVADHYGIPSIHMGLKVARMEREGKLVFGGAEPKTDAEKAKLGDKILFSPDSVHPYDAGHQLYFEAVLRSWAAIRGAGEPVPHKLVVPMVADNWERAEMVPFGKAKLSAGWEKLESEAGMVKLFGNRVPGLWKANAPGESILFRFRGTTARIYDLLGPDCGQVTVIVDNGAPLVKPRLESYCTYHRLATLSVAEGLPDGLHTVKVTLHPEQPDKAEILRQRAERMYDPKRFDGTAWYAGAILLIGELVEE